MTNKHMKRYSTSVYYGNENQSHNLTTTRMTSLKSKFCLSKKNLRGCRSGAEAAGLLQFVLQGAGTAVQGPATAEPGLGRRQHSLPQVPPRRRHHPRSLRW